MANETCKELLLLNSHLVGYSLKPRVSPAPTQTVKLPNHLILVMISNALCLRLIFPPSAALIQRVAVAEEDLLPIKDPPLALLQAVRVLLNDKANTIQGIVEK